MQEVINAVVLDNDIEHLVGITTALTDIGISTLPVHYKDPTSAKAGCQNTAQAFPRVVITDIQLRDGGTEPTKSDLSNVALCLGEIIKETKGPYVVLAWTSKPEALDDLKERVEEYFLKAKIRLPAYFDSISKNDCKKDNGEFDPAQILQKFQEHLESQATIRALMHWEKGVISAAHRAVNALIEVPNGSLEDTLHQLAIQAVGKENLANHESLAINTAISGILRDELTQYSADCDAKDRWREALKINTSTADIAACHKLNSLLHYDLSPNEEIIFPGDVFIFDHIELFLADVVGKDELFEQAQIFIRGLLPKRSKDLDTAWDNFFVASKVSKLKKAKEKLVKDYELPRRLISSRVKFALLEVSPACDFSQRNRGIKPFVMGLLVPTRALVGVYGGNPAEHVVSNSFHWEGDDYTFRVSANYQVYLSEQLVMKQLERGVIKNRFRMRDNLLQSWIQKIANHNSRIGTISFH